mmetsp:Transcript_20940/g.39181  ORF Transcript_20940/g.39181 Transcript_20940/m.39181 type:complete len:335 (-) Transcript_20940:3976-4980(-)
MQVGPDSASSDLEDVVITSRDGARQHDALQGGLGHGRELQFQIQLLSLPQAAATLAAIDLEHRIVLALRPRVVDVELASIGNTQILHELLVQVNVSKVHVVHSPPALDHLPLAISVRPAALFGEQELSVDSITFALHVQIKLVGLLPSVADEVEVVELLLGRGEIHDNRNPAVGGNQAAHRDQLQDRVPETREDVTGPSHAHGIEVETERQILVVDDVDGVGQDATQELGAKVKPLTVEGDHRLDDTSGKQKQFVHARARNLELVEALRHPNFVRGVLEDHLSPLPCQDHSLAGGAPPSGAWVAHRHPRELVTVRGRVDDVEPLRVPHPRAPAL